MNLRKTLLAGALTLGLLGSIAAPAAIAQDDADVWVTVTSGGTFAAIICDPAASITAMAPVATENINLTQTTTNAPTAAAAGLATGTFGICYQDDIANRAAGFNTVLGASNFVLQSDTTKTIGKQNFRIVATGGVAQAQSSTFNNPHNLIVGDIGTFVNQLDPGGQPSPLDPVVPWNANNTFAGDVKVHYGYSGAGTIMSGGQVDVALTLPIGTVPGQYKSDLTLTVVTDPTFTRTP